MGYAMYVICTLVGRAALLWIGVRPHPGAYVRRHQQGRPPRRTSRRTTPPPDRPPQRPISTDGWREMRGSKARTVAAAVVGARRVAAAAAAPGRPDLWLPAAHLLACARARTDRPIRLDCVGSVDVCMSDVIVVGQSEHMVWLGLDESARITRSRPLQRSNDRLDRSIDRGTMGASINPHFRVASRQFGPAAPRARARGRPHRPQIFQPRVARPPRLHRCIVHCRSVAARSARSDDDLLTCNAIQNTPFFLPSCPLVKAMHWWLRRPNSIDIRLKSTHT